MAIDTEDKLRSLIGLNYFPGPGFKVTSTVDENYLIALCYGYLGLNYTERVAPDTRARMIIVKEQIRSVLINDSVYLGHLNNPSSFPYQTYFIYPPKKPTFPYVVYSMRPGVNNPLVGKALLSKRIDLDFNIWSQDDTYEEIAARIIFLLNQEGNSHGFRIIYDSDRSELYDPELNAYGVSITFNLFLRKGKI